MSVTVVIPLHDGGPWIEAALASVSAQSLPPAELLVVDDASRDDGPARVRALGVPLVASPERGSVRARNFGARETTASAIAFLDQDDLWHPRHLELLVAALEADPGAPAAVAHVRPFPDGTLPRLDGEPGPARALDPWHGFPVALGGVQMLSAGLLRRTAFEALGGLDFDHAGVADVHFWYRLSTERPLVQVRARSAGRRLHATSMSHSLRARGLDFCQRQARAARAALDWRRARRGRDAQDARLEARCQALEHACRALGAWERGDLPACRAATSPLAEALAGDEPKFAVRLFDKLLWSLIDDGPDARLRRCNVLETLIRVWPDPAAAAARSLRALLAEGPAAGGA